ncbi:MAG TPA: glycosyltransferase family 2 protein [Chloroflexota bacterium]|nr:glycosyltransferase family 2 protein [Chloroflexota bacterium]
MPALSVAMPAHNEAENIVRVLTDAVDVLERIEPDYEIVVVDDGSRDNTANLVRQFAETHDRVRLVRHPVNQGYGAAVWTGLTSSTGEKRFFTDSDAQFKLDEIQLLLDEMPPADFVAGYRTVRQDTFMRKLNGKGWTALVNLLFGYAARDVDCAFKLMRSEVVECLPVQSRGATFSAELLVRARRAGFVMREVGVTHLPRTAGSPSGAKLHVILRAFKELLRLWKELRLHPQPLVRQSAEPAPALAPR